MEGTYYRLPTGGTTKSVQRYIRSWKGPGSLVARAMGYRLHGFDPNYSFLPKDDSLDCGLCQIATDAVLNLAAALRSRR